MSGKDVDKLCWITGQKGSAKEKILLHSPSDDCLSTIALDGAGMGIVIHLQIDDMPPKFRHIF